MSSISCPNAACAATLEGSDLRHCPRCGAFLPLSEKDASDPLVGQPILQGKYRILSVIGEGGMGKVYLAEQKLGNATRKVAIKTLQPDLAQDPQIIARFHRETQTVIELEHPNTIKFFDFGELDDHGKKLFVVMEFIQGESLAHVLARGPLDVARAERIMGQICGSLQEAHDHGIVHRDLKPENIYLTQKGARGDFVKVLDFGIAKRDEPPDAKEAKLTRQGMVLGTPPYMSPEQFTGQTLDARSDIYALSVMSYEMLCGALPFTAATPWEWATKHLTAQPIPFEQQANGAQVAPRHRAAIMRGLRKNRDERQASVTEYLQEFAGHSEGATDWTSSSTSMPGAGNVKTPAPQQGMPLGVSPTMASAPFASGGFAPGGMPPTGLQNVQHPHATPNPFMGTSAPGQGFVPSPSSAGFAGVPGTVAPGVAGSNPGFPNPTGNFGAMPGGQPYPYQGMMPQAAPKKSSKGLIFGILTVIAVLGGGGWAVNYYLIDDDDDDAPQAQQQPAPSQPAVPAAPGTGSAPPIAPTPYPSGVPAGVQPMPTIPTPQPPPAAQPTPSPAVAAPAPRPNPVNNAPAPPPDPRVTAAINRGMAAIGANNFSGAVDALHEAASVDANASGVGRLRGELRRRGRNRIDNLILGGNCAGAQQLYRELRGAGAAPGTDSFGDACPVP